MKKYFIAGLGVVLVLSIFLIFYGAYLNEQGEIQIARRMQERHVELVGAKVIVREMRPVVRFSAVNIYSENTADAVARVNGRIAQTFIAKNSEVHKGDVLFELENEDMAISIKEAEAGILNANANLKRARNNFERYKQLREQNATSVKEFDEAESAYISAEANLQVAIAKRDKILAEDSRRVIHAPIDGTIRVLYRQVGDYVQAGTALALIGDYRVLYFTDDVTDDEAKMLHIGQEAQLIFPDSEFRDGNVISSGSELNGSVRKFLAVLTEISPPLSEMAQARTILWKIDNSDRLLTPQTYGAARLELQDGYKALCIPLSALDESETMVFVHQDGQIRKRAVTIGQEDGTFVEIVGGLREGEVVITSGAEHLSDGTRANVTLHEGER